MATVNFYDVLDVSQDSDQNTIKRKYRELTKVHHPDKPGGDADLFELITHAFRILSNPETRADYDKIYHISQQSHIGFINIREQYKNFIMSSKTDATRLTKKESQKAFDKNSEDLDKKYNFERNSSGRIITKAVTSRDFRDLELTREQDDIERVQNNIFEGVPFNNSRFQAAFESVNRNSAIIPHEGNPDPWKGNSECNYSSIKNSNSLYTEDDILDACVDYAPISKIDSHKNLTKEDVDNLQDVSYTENHNKNKSEYAKVIEKRLQERNQQRQSYSKENMNQSDFDSDPTCGGYGIYHNIGIPDSQSLQWGNDDDIKTRYNRLLEQRKNGN